ncbi:hypothetical protein GCM10010244_56790 [Streptomyces coeruleorubidus]|nr:hypothetical protein GCM10010244_56790 [Streptomyces bellus]
MGRTRGNVREKKRDAGPAGRHPEPGRRRTRRPDRRQKATPMNGSRIPGLVLPSLFLLALVVGLWWYWRHRGDS